MTSYLSHTWHSRSQATYVAAYHAVIMYTYNLAAKPHYYSVMMVRMFQFQTTGMHCHVDRRAGTAHALLLGMNLKVESLAHAEHHVQQTTQQLFQLCKIYKLKVVPKIRSDRTNGPETASVV